MTMQAIGSSHRTAAPAAATKLAHRMSRDEELLREVLDAYRAEYKELHEDWRALDTKAQGTITVCGIFIAGIFALLKDLSLATPSDVRQSLTVTTVLLTISIVACVMSFFVRDVRVPRAEDHEENVSALIDAKRIDNTSIANYLRDQCIPWKEANDSISAKKNIKASLLVFGQFSLVCALLAAAYIILQIANQNA